MAATAQVPDGFEIDPATGMPRLKRQQSTVAAVQPAIDSPFASQAPTIASPTTPQTSTDPATTGATFLPNTTAVPRNPPPTTPPITPPNGTRPDGSTPQPGDPDYVGAPDPTATTPPSTPPTITTPPTTGVSAQFDTFAHNKDWQGLFKAITAAFYQDANGAAGGLLSPTSPLIQQLTKYGFKISPANANGEVTKIQTPDGHWIRVLGGPKGGYDYTWVDNGVEGSGGNTPTTPTTPTDPLAGIPPWSPDAAFHEAILRLLKQGETPVSADDPTIKATTDAARVAGTREVQQARASAAERAAAEGVPTSTFDNAVLGNQEKFGENMSGLQAQLMTTELQSRRAQVVNALQFARGEDAQKLQAYLGNLDAALRAAGLKQQNQQFYDTLSFNYTSEEDLMNRFIQSLLLKPAA